MATLSSTKPDEHGGLSAEFVSCSDPDEATVAAMFSLYASSYADTSDGRFRRDLEGKTHVLLLTQAGGILCGFTTLELYSSTAAGPPIRVIFSGDTVIDPKYWGSPVLALEWLRFAGTVAHRSQLPLYWLLIVKGHRTYRYLSTFANRYIPHHEFPDAPDDRSILTALAREKFGELFDDATGIIHFPSPQGRLSDELAEIPDRHRRLRPVEHFIKLNPGFRDGDELVCLCRLAGDNLRPMAARAFGADIGQSH
ncbi:MAG: hypothetical protein ABI557_04875 [Aureliella sp.]